MTRCGFVCLLLGAMAWGQAATPKPSPAPQTPAGQGSSAAKTTEGTPQEAEAPKVAPDAPVITIKGVCDQSAAKAPALECRTIITRAEFEKIVEAVQPNMPARVRRQFATRYANALAMSMKAEEMGLDKGPDYDERMRLARIQVLSGELNKAMQDKASQIADKEIEDYYKSNPDKFEQVETNRIYVPKTQQQPAEEDKDKKLSEAEQQKRTQASEQTMKNEADKLRARAAAGEDFTKLQEEAYQLAGLKSSAPNTSMGKIRRNMLPASQASVLDLKPGEVSSVISDQSGYFIYKLVSKETMPLDQAREEIKGTLRSQRLQDEMKAVQESTTPTLDEAYFGPETPPRGAMPPGAPGIPPSPVKPAVPPGPK